MKAGCLGKSGVNAVMVKEGTNEQAVTHPKYLFLGLSLNVS